MAAIRPMERIKKKWVDKASIAGPDYSWGVENPKKLWEEEAAKAEETYHKAITAPDIGKRFVGGVKRAGQSKYQEMAKRKGSTRYPEGITLGEPFYDEGFAPFRDEIERTELPPKLPKGDPGNIKRVSVIASALHAKKKALLGIKG